MFKTSKLVISAAACMALVSLTLPARAYTYNPRDFATEVVQYVEGTGVGNDWLSGDPFNNPDMALGRPTVDTTGDGWTLPLSTNVTVAPTGPAFRAFELVSIGTGGHLTVKFDHRVLNDPNNPYGIDLVVFGNTSLTLDGAWWENNDPADVTIGSSMFGNEPGAVSVSQNGTDWYTFDLTQGAADAFAPTAGRVLDRANPDTSVGAWNQWWGEATDPTMPLDPSLGLSDFTGKTLEEVCAMYGTSAGGAGFDLDWLNVPGGLDWIQYVRVEGNAAATTEVDAFADVAPLGTSEIPEPTTLIGLALGGLTVAARRRRTT
ncbi:MAG: PEP-CTERM sorting domain-containing protein [Planctomycetota bacterium]